MIPEELAAVRGRLEELNRPEFSGGSGLPRPSWSRVAGILTAQPRRRVRGQVWISAGVRRKVLDLVAAGRPIVDLARDLGISAQSVYTWRRQNRVDKVLEPGLNSAEKWELTAAGRRLSGLDAVLAIHLRATELLAGVVSPQGGSRPSR